MEFLKLLLTAFFSATALFIIAKLMGHKQVAQLGFEDSLKINFDAIVFKTTRKTVLIGNRSVALTFEERSSAM